jgi:hypothetical protein
VIVILSVSILVLVVILMSLLKTQRALRWWQNQQALQLHQVAEEIRDGLLQQSFSLRRNLEVDLDGVAASRMVLTQTWLNSLEGLHHDFKLLSDFLSPPYLEESFPLALQYQMEAWQVRHPGCEFTLKLPALWQQELSDRGQVMLTALDQLLRLTVSQAFPGQSIRLCLRAEQSTAELSVQISTPEGLNLEVRNLRRLARAVPALVDGSCFYQRDQNQLTMYFRWKYVEDSNPQSSAASP